MLFSLGLLPSDKIVETSALDLTADYVGQTSTKVTEKLREAKGGVLFIDEAYNLGFGPFGKEACDTIVAAMTSDMYKDVVIVIAGYRHEMDNMLKSNAGLKSRFTHFFNFPDWQKNDCRSFFEQLSFKRNFALEDGVLDAVEKGCVELIPLDGWANGRDVTKLWEQIKSNRDARVYETDETRRSLCIEDVHEALTSMLSARQPKLGGKLQSNDPPSELFPSPEVASDSNELHTPSFQTITGILQQQNSVSTSTIDDEELSAEEDSESERTIGVKTDASGRDVGVSDEDWSELQNSKERDRLRSDQWRRKQEEYEQWLIDQAEKEREAQRLYELEIERLRMELEQAELEQALRLAEEKERQRKHNEDLERRRKEDERLRREEENRKHLEMQKRLRMIGKCPLGFAWHNLGSGWVCGGGSHHVSDEQLQRQFGYDI